MRLPPVLLAIAVGITFAVGASGQTPRAPEPPQVLSKGWLPHAQSLVRQERAVGVVLREHQMHDTFVADAALVPVLVRETTRGRVTRLMSDDALRCRTALERPVVPLVLRGTPLAVLFDLMMQDASASAGVPPGVLGGASPLPRSNERMGQQLEVRVEIGDTLTTALDRLVSAGLPSGGASSSGTRRVRRRARSCCSRKTQCGGRRTTRCFRRRRCRESAPLRVGEVPP